MNTGIKASLKTYCSKRDIILPGHIKKASRFLQIPSKRPLNENVLASHEGGKNGPVVTIYTSSADDEVDVVVIGNFYLLSACSRVVVGKE